MTDKEKIKKLEDENKKLKEKLEKLERHEKHDSPGWDFHWDGRGDYEESRRCFYGDFS